MKRRAQRQTSGYCEKCGKLTPIVALEVKTQSRERRWFPKVHDGCNGHMFEILDHKESPPPLTTLRAPRAN